MQLVEKIRTSFRRASEAPINTGVITSFQESEEMRASVPRISVDPQSKRISLPEEIEREIRRGFDHDPDVQRRRRQAGLD